MCRKIVAKTFWTFGLIVLGSIASVCAAEADFPHKKEAFRHVARELQNRKVVALADFAHGNAYPYHTLMQVLSQWLDLTASTGGRLVLVMEMDDESTSILREYLRTGDIEPILDYWLPFSSLDQLAFYNDLREFALRVQRVNEGLAEDRKIGFHVLGLETFSMWALGNAHGADLPDISQAGQIANERDRQVAAALLAYLKEHPEEKVLAFYGMDHLRIRETRRSWAGQLFGSTQLWQPMAFLLKRELGDDFLSIAQNPLPPGAFDRESLYRDVKSRDIFMKSADIPWKLTRIDPADFDAVVFLSSSQIDEAHLLKYICSRRILEQAIAKLARIEKLPRNGFTAMYRVPSDTLAGLRLITGQPFETSAQWQQWTTQNPYDGFSRMDSGEFAEVVRLACARPADRQRNTMLMSLGLPAAYHIRQQQISPEQWVDTWSRLSPRVRFLQCVGIYWVGYPTEREKARKYLVQVSGQELDSAALYLKWYRKACLGLTY